MLCFYGIRDKWDRIDFDFISFNCIGRVIDKFRKSPYYFRPVSRNNYNANFPIFSFIFLFYKCMVFKNFCYSISRRVISPSMITKLLNTSLARISMKPLLPMWSGKGNSVRINDNSGAMNERFWANQFLIVSSILLYCLLLILYGLW